MFSKQILIYGNEKVTVIINGVFVKDSINVGLEIKESILSTVLDENLVTDPRAALSYTVNETVGSLYFLSVMGNSMLFNRDLKTPTQSADKVSLIIDKSFAKLNIENKKLFCISRIKKYPEDNSMIIEKGIKELEIANMTGYELYAENKDEEMYQVILFDEDGTYYIFVGTYIKGSEKALSDIKSIIMTFERK